MDRAWPPIAVLLRRRTRSQIGLLRPMGAATMNALHRAGRFLTRCVCTPHTPARCIRFRPGSYDFRSGGGSVPLKRTPNLPSKSVHYPARPIQFAEALPCEAVHCDALLGWARFGRVMLCAARLDTPSMRVVDGSLALRGTALPCVSLHCPARPGEAKRGTALRCQANPRRIHAVRRS